MNIYFQDIIERIRIHYKKMTNTERVIADFFLTNTEKMELPQRQWRRGCMFRNPP